MSTTQQPEALRLLDWFEESDGFKQGTQAHHKWVLQAEQELRRQHARISELEAQLSAIGAGGVEPLRKREAAPQAAVPETREALGKRLIADVKVANAIAAVACQRVAELPDRDSPADWPEAMLVTGDELHMIVREAAIEAQAAPAHHAEGVPAQAAALLTTGGQAQEQADARDVERLQSLLCRMIDQLERRRKFRDGNAPGHSHGIPGIWDSDNGELAGKKCAWCEVWQEALEVHAAAQAKQGGAGHG